jgi:3-deoxy-D-manno-octulosonic-acid transferase
VLRALYTASWYLLAPLLPLRLLWRGRREPGYLAAIGERYGRYAQRPAAPVIWVHAVSLGETRAAAPLVARLRRAHPDATILVTHMTATGRAASEALFGDDVIRAWLPYDLPFAMRRFLDHFAPRVGLVMETELWPNLLAAASHRRIPLYLVNARLSERSARGYRRIGTLARSMLEALAGVAAQGAADADRLAALGAPRPVVTGNIKFDVEPGDEARARGRELRTLFGAARPVWVAGSTRDGEEALLVDALRGDRLPPATLTVIVPRHPQRFDAVAELLRARGVAFCRRSENRSVPAGVSVVLGDSMGEMMAYYAAADVAFVGGSLLPLGGQNLIEPIAAGTPTLVGPHMFNFAEATARAKDAGAAREVADASQLVATVASLLVDAAAREKMRDAALAFHAAHRGAADRLWAWLAPRVDAALAADRASAGKPA